MERIIKVRIVTPVNKHLPKTKVQKLERHIVLVSPEIHWNTGNIGRTCVATDILQDLQHPFGGVTGLFATALGGPPAPGLTPASVRNEIVGSHGRRLHGHLRAVQNHVSRTLESGSSSHCAQVQTMKQSNPIPLP